MQSVNKHCRNVIEIYCLEVSDQLITIDYIFHKFVGKYSERFLIQKLFQNFQK
jgi:hypothetical protein